MGHDDRMATQSLRSTNMIGVRMTVDDMRDWFIGYFSDRMRKVRDQSLRNINHHDTAIINKEHRLNRVVSDHVQTATHILEAITFDLIYGRSTRCSRDIEILAGSYTNRCNGRHVRVWFPRR